jgi:hypothetical protein
MNSVTARSTGAGRHRPHASVRRKRRLTAWFTDGELDAIKEAAGKAGMKPGAYLAKAGTDAAAAAAAAGGLPAAGVADVVDGMSGAMRALNRVGNNFNQAVARLHALGEHSPDLEASAAAVARAAARVERAVLWAARRLR